MAKFTNIFQHKFLRREKPKEVSELVKEENKTQQIQVVDHIESFSNVFGKKELGDKEKEEILSLLQKFSPGEENNISNDFSDLISITSEVKAINNQAALLHGERIKRAQGILKNYRDGAFTSWLIATYGNRQTPYNFLQYYEFHNQIPDILHNKIESMPRQAVYTLASRQGDLCKKEEIVRNYNGETKQEMISLIRSHFPLSEGDGRRENVGEMLIKTIGRLISGVEKRQCKMTLEQKKELYDLTSQLNKLIDICETE